MGIIRDMDRPRIPVKPVDRFSSCTGIMIKSHPILVVEWRDGVGDLQIQLTVLVDDLYLFRAQTWRRKLFTIG